MWKDLPPWRGPIDQIRFLRADLDANVRGRWWRWVSVPLQPGIMSIIGYRVSRAAWLALGAPYRALHTLLAPLRMVLVISRDIGDGAARSACQVLDAGGRRSASEAEQVLHEQGQVQPISG